MSDNFWDTKLSEGASTGKGDKNPKKLDLSKQKVKINVKLEDFPVGYWDSDNDAIHIVQWYNDNRMAVEEKSLDFFKHNTGIKLVTSKAEAQKILDLAIQTMQQEGVTVWRPPSHEFEKESNNTIQLNNIETFRGLIGGWFFAGIWFTISFLILFLIGGPAIADLGTADWNATDGVITSSEVYTSTDGEGTTYCLWVDYEYTYDGKTYNGDVVSYSKDNSCDSWSGNADDDYPEGKEITVYVNPDNPYEAVLEPGLSGVDLGVCCILPFPLIGILLVAMILKATFRVVSSKFNKSG
jgi:hypothetical protein